MVDGCICISQIPHTESKGATHASKLQSSCNSLLVVTVLDRQLSFPQHGTPQIRQVHGFDTLDGGDQLRGAHVPLVTIRTASQGTDEQLGGSDARAPVLDGGVEVRLSDVAVAVVVELDPDVVQLCADSERDGSIGVWTLRRSSHVVFLAAVGIHV